MTKQFPLSAFIITLERSSLKVLRAYCSALVMLLCTGNRALWRIEAVVVLMVSLVSSGKGTVAASISQTISLTGIFDGVGANFGPFSRMECSAEESGLFDKLTTQLSLLIEVE